MKLEHPFFGNMTVHYWAASFRSFETNTVYRNVVARLPIKAGSYFRSTDTLNTALWKFKKVFFIRIMLTLRRVRVTISVV